MDTKTTENVQNSNEYQKFIDVIRNMQANTLLLNESDEKDNNDDLNALLKDDAGLDEGGEDSGKKSEGDDNLDDLNFDDLKNNKEGSSDEKGSDNPDGNLDNLGGGEDASSDENNFETDSEGLMDTITRLTKAGHTVKIVVRQLAA